jgi:hypothetical protein
VTGYKIPRRRYFLLAAGFVPVVAAEWSFYWVMAGNPFYRFGVDANAIRVPTSDAIGGVLPRGASPPFSIAIMRAWAPTGPVHVHWLLDPYIDFVLNGSFGFLCVTGMWSAVLLLRSRLAPPLRSFATLICAWAAVATFVLLYVLNSDPLARYFTPVAWTMAVMTGLWIRNGIMVRSVAAAGGILFALALIDITLINLRPDPVHITRELVSFERDQATPVWVDSSIVLADLVIADAGLSSRTRSASPEAISYGSLLFTTALRARQLEAEGWTVVWRPQTEMAAVARPISIVQRWLPERVLQILERGYPAGVVLRRPAEAAFAVDTGQMGMG